MRKGEIACYKQFLLFSKRFLPYMALIYHFKRTLKVALQISGQKIYKNTKISLYSQSLLFFIHKTSVVESHPTTSEIRKNYYGPGRHPTGNTVYFYMSSSLIYILNTHRQSFKQRTMKTLWKINTCLLCYGIQASPH